MQKLMREYLNELKNRRRRRRQARIAMVILISLVVGSVIGALAQYGVAMTGNAKCGIEEHQHELACYEKTQVCTQLESAGHQHTDECYQTETSLVCGLEESEEHTHSDGCYATEQQIICSEEEGTGHQHTDACYEEELACGKELHTHGEECYIDTDADVEDAAVWNKQYEKIEWKDTWSENLVMAAREQIGYKESSDNYTIAEDGSHKGYTRYGQFAVDTGAESADVYADWDTAFVNFCLFYAGLSATDIFPDKLDTVEWYEEFRKINENIDGYLSCLVAPEGYMPKAGDLVIFQKGIEEEEREYQMGIVSSYDKEKDELKVIEGNSGNEVKENDYYIEAKDAQDDEMAPVFCYVDMSGIEKAYKGTDDEEQDPVEPGTPVEPEEPEEPKDDVTEEEDPAEDPKEENPDGETDGEEEPEEEETKEETIELTTKVDGTTITLSGPASSFEEGEKYEIQAKKVEDEETIATIEEAIDKEVEKQEKKVENYQAFDIKLMLDGEEVQPLGPVEVKFSGREVAKSVDNEETEVSVLHVDEETGEATDMEATATEEKEVVIETEHFSVYVYVELEFIYGKATITVEHWGEGIATTKGEANAADLTDTAFTHGAHGTSKEIELETSDMEIYTADEFEYPNGSYQKLENMSKVYLVGKVNEEGEVDEEAQINEEKINYTISKVWICNGKENIGVNKGKEKWEPGTYDEVSLNGDRDIKIDKDSLIRFWYKPKQRNDKVVTQANFYDYDISDGKFWNKDGTKSNETRTDIYKYLKTDEQGINSSFMGDGAKFGVGQVTSGNTSSWAGTDTIRTNGGNYFLNKATQYKELSDGSGKVAMMTPGIVQPTLQGVNKEDGSGGTLQFTSGVAAATNLFQEGTGSKEYIWDLGFKQNGDTYTLQYVNHDTAHDYTKITSRTQYPNGQSYGKTISSNDFWPMDRETNGDPHMGKGAENKGYASVKDYAFLKKVGDQWEAGKDGNWNAEQQSDDGLAHNWYFGMTYEVRFTIGDYVGPMKYYFRGDDDFWLFVDGKQIVDIGGIHSSLGQTVDLQQKMIEKGLLEYDKDGKLKDKNKKHTLKVFYMERGATGSCCYMQFTLPQTEPISIPTPAVTEYEVRKNWSDNESGFRPESITVKLVQKRQGTDTVTGKSEPVTLDASNGWRKRWSDLPVEKGGKTEAEKYSYSYEVEEINLPAGYRSELVDGVLTNILEPVELKVEKDWINDSGLEDYRPQKVRIGLYYYDASEYKPYIDKSGNHKYVELTAGNENETDPNKWSGTFSDLPQYSYKWNEETQKWDASPVKYTIREMYLEGDTWKPIPNNGNSLGNNANYKVTYSGLNTTIPSQDWVVIEESKSATLTVTNTLLTKFKIMKKGTEEGTPNLKGAEFVLLPYSSSNEEETDVIGDATLVDMSTQIDMLEGEIYKGISDEQGLILWKDSNGKPVENIPEGEYLMKEVKAPVGYAISTEEWIIKVGGYGRATITKKDGSPIKPNTITESGSVELMFEYFFLDEALYELPSTGGPGTYWYMFSGVLLLAVTALITYRNKRKEVLRS